MKWDRPALVRLVYSVMIIATMVVAAAAGPKWG